MRYRFVIGMEDEERIFGGTYEKDKDNDSTFFGDCYDFWL